MAFGEDRVSLANPHFDCWLEHTRDFGNITHVVSVKAKMSLAITNAESAILLFGC